MNFPLLDAFLTMLWFFLWILWIFLVVRVIIDIFRSHDLGGVAKAVWLVLVLILPLLGVLAYLIIRGDRMSKHEMGAAEARDEEVRAYMRDAVGTTGTADELTRLAELRQQGHLSEREYESAKAKVLSGR